MHVSVYVPMLAAVLLGAAAPGIARRLAPALAARLLTGCVVLAGLSSLWALGLIAGLRLLEEPSIAREGHLASRMIVALDPVPHGASIAAAALAIGAMVRGMGLICREAKARRLLSVLPVPAAGDVLVMTDAVPRAYAIPGRRAGVLVSTGLLQMLDDTERAVVLAHERAHLRHRHDTFRALGAAAAAVNPVLIPVRRAIGFALERWADEDAAAVTGDRAVVARTLAKASLAMSPQPARTGLGLADHSVVERVAALGRDTPLRSRRAVVGCLTLCAAGGLAVLDATISAAHLLIASGL